MLSQFSIQGRTNTLFTRLPPMHLKSFGIQSALPLMIVIRFASA
jgi:hypothetical protein